MKGSGKPFVDRKQADAKTDDEIMCFVIECISSMAISSHDFVFAGADKPSLGNHAVRWKIQVVVLIVLFVQEPVSALQEEDVSWVLVGLRSAVTACPPTHAQDVPINPCPRKNVDRCRYEP